VRKQRVAARAPRAKQRLGASLVVGLDSVEPVIREIVMPRSGAVLKAAHAKP